ncbi:hypothetical protein MMAG44476_37888 [Mycolicibacterium mageritense DSM 44476 = CIP 104973]|uniref:Uncharacterized protein n=1 Tax=Mycolicibacterium mageritense TaxID=53462 RepID=A0ABN5XYB7_MYCME|nr:hypothetical protein [Mycolicibacterium mageritense]BBX30948.1 hypothetical protein MMAGJ_02300 [Mycolicibacterium mageritense]CDO26229.1 hypothetical protein BN978_06784 [Mycolicibacterium mageritense DSM 44476 = CIP 104973]
MNHDNRRPISAATRADITGRFSTLTDSSLSGETDNPALAAMAEQILSGLLHADGLAAQHYERKAPGFLAAHQSVSFLPELARIAANAVAADRQMIDGDDGGPWVIFTTRPGERYALATPGILDAALDTVAGDIACDLRRSWGGNGYCVSDMNMSKRHKLPPTDKSGKMLNRPFTFPFAHGEYLVLSRICIDCWIDFVKHYEIKDVRIQNPWETLG